MSKTVTLRIGENIYDMFSAMAERENRPLSNFIETAALRYLQEHELTDEFEMREISQNANLLSSLKRGHADAKARRGRFV
jgi:predicted transcriptional regulator